MPIFTTGQQSEAPSQLTHGWHPAILYGIRTEPIPPYFARSLEKDTHEWRWYVAIWQTAGDLIDGKEPELRTLSTTRTWTPERKSPKGDKLSASKAYTWTCALLGRIPGPTEAVTLDDKLPLPVLVNVERRPDSQYIRLPELMAWPAQSTNWPEPTIPPSIAGYIAMLPEPIVDPPRPQAPRATTAPSAPPPAPAPQPPGMRAQAAPEPDDIPF